MSIGGIVKYNPQEILDYFRSLKVKNNCRIGEHCVDVKDVLDNTIVMLSEKRFIKHEKLKDNTFNLKMIKSNLKRKKQFEK